MRAEIVHMRLFDLGAEVDLARLKAMRGQAPVPAPVEARSPTPLSLTFSQPLEVTFAPPDAPAGARVEVRVHALGALTVRLRWPCEADGLAGLAAAADAFRAGGLDAASYARQVMEEVRRDIGPALLEPYQAGIQEERYIAYCVHAPPAEVPALLQREQAAIAQLVSDAPGQPLVPSRQEAAVRHTMQYTPGDAVVVGWDHAVVLDEPGEYEDVLDVMELANIELLEFRTYDAYLDGRLEDAFDALDRLWAPGGLFRSARSALQEISRLRVEFARLTDNLHDTGKIFGDWYTAQLHRRLHERFHVASWGRAVAAKMDTLEDMFHLAQEEANHRRSLLLEVLIVLLFVLDLAVLLELGG